MFEIATAVEKRTLCWKLSIFVCLSVYVFACVDVNARERERAGGGKG